MKTPVRLIFLPAWMLAAPALAEGFASRAPAVTLPDAGLRLVDVERISAGDTAWMLVASVLVLLMTLPGLALFYAGMVRRKNVLATLMQSLAVGALVPVLWVTLGYSLAFTPGSRWIGGLERVWLDGMHYSAEAGKVTVQLTLAPTIPESVFMLFQMGFAILAAALITGAVAERMKFSALLWFTALWSLLVYAPVAHWVWAPGGWLFEKGMLDFAGGAVVHVNAGVAGLVSAWVLGPRLGWRRESMAPHNLTLTLIGAALLWVGWFGFNAGSAMAADGRAGLAMAVTQMAAASAALSWMFAEWLSKGKPLMLGLVSGAVAGLVAITPAAGFVDARGALAIGALAGIGCHWGATSLKHMLGVDDALDVFGVHGVGGILGALLAGVFAAKPIGGVDGSLAVQALGVAVTAGYSLIATWLLLKVLDATLGLRVSEEQEREGLDLALHGERVL